MSTLSSHRFETETPRGKHNDQSYTGRGKNLKYILFVFTYYLMHRYQVFPKLYVLEYLSWGKFSMNIYSN